MNRFAPFVLASTVALGAALLPASHAIADDSAAELLQDAPAFTSEPHVDALVPDAQKAPDMTAPEYLAPGPAAPLPMDGSPALEAAIVQGDLALAGSAAPDGSSEYAQATSIYPAYNEDRYYFDIASKGDQASFLMTALSGNLDPYLRLYDSNNRLLLEADDVSPTNFNALLEYQFLVPGRYSIIARSYRNESSGNYLLTMRFYWPDVALTDAFTTNTSNVVVSTVYRGNDAKLWAAVYNKTGTRQRITVRFTKPSGALCSPLPCTETLSSGDFWVNPRSTSYINLVVPVRRLSSYAGTANWAAEVINGGWTLRQAKSVTVR